jgi:hypothetical protein
MELPALTGARIRAIAAAAVAAGALVVVVVPASGHQDAKPVWAVFGPGVGLSFVGTGLYAWRRQPESRTGALMVLLGFAWFLSAPTAADSLLPAGMGARAALRAPRSHGVEDASENAR